MFITIFKQVFDLWHLKRLFHMNGQLEFREAVRKMSYKNLMSRVVYTNAFFLFSHPHLLSSAKIVQLWPKFFNYYLSTKNRGQMLPLTFEK